MHVQLERDEDERIVGAVLTAGHRVVSFEVDPDTGVSCMLTGHFEDGVLTVETCVMSDRKPD